MINVNIPQNLMTFCVSNIFHRICHKMSLQLVNNLAPYIEIFFWQAVRIRNPVLC